MNVSRSCLLSLLLVGLSGCSSGSGEYGGFWNGLGSTAERKAPAASSGGQDLLRCAAKKCLTVYLAPWCPHCRDAQPAILALRDYLKGKGVPTQIVVGQDRPEALAAYAKELGPETVIDEGGALGAGGVPHFYVSDQGGNVLKDQAGIPRVDDPVQLAAFLSLP